MEYRKFGSTDLKPSVLGFGCARIASFLTKSSEKEVLLLLHEAMEAGINFFDTSDIYGQGDSERLIGKAVRKNRDQIIIETKAGNCFSSAAKAASRFKAPIRSALKYLPFLKRNVQRVRAAQLSQNFTPEYLSTAVDASLQRLGTDYIDVFMLHSPPITLIQHGELNDLAEGLKKSGKIRYFGISCDTGDAGLLCLEHPAIDAIQVPVNHKESLVLQSVLPLAYDKGVAVVGRSPFATGNLFQIPETENTVSEDSTLNTAQAALLAAASHKGVSTVIAGMSSSRHLRENLAPFNSCS